MTRKIPVTYLPPTQASTKPKRTLRMPKWLLQTCPTCQELSDFRHFGALEYQCQTCGAIHALQPEAACHPDCGPIVERRDGQHAHDGGPDGICWHEDEQHA